MYLRLALLDLERRNVSLDVPTILGEHTLTRDGISQLQAPDSLAAAKPLSTATAQAGTAAKPGWACGSSTRARRPAAVASRRWPLRTQPARLDSVRVQRGLASPTALRSLQHSLTVCVVQPRSQYIYSKGSGIWVSSAGSRTPAHNDRTSPL